MCRRNKLYLYAIIVVSIGIILTFSRFGDIAFIGVKTEILEKWSIGVHRFCDVDIICGIKSCNNIEHPVLTANDISDRDAIFVADPFLVYEYGIYYMFFEVSCHDNGDIGLAVSTDGLNWEYKKIVLDESFHLSYPYVFEDGIDYYMIPESHEVNSVRLYKARNFPYEWEYVKDILNGKGYRDPSIFFYQNKFWLFTTIDKYSTLYLYYADKIEGPWQEHPKNPIVRGDSNIARPGGNVIVTVDRLIRIAQDDYPTYGNAIRAFDITTINTADYIEKELAESPLLNATGKSWNKDGMHQLSLVHSERGGWLACVDGKEELELHYVAMKVPMLLGKCLKYLIK